ncbi:hypothetical protein C7425_101251 [Pantoea ananatis]|uniref:Uncharacterized protein n=1 Tax=Pantoea eucalypti TaxID=470933 RepID=A0ABY2ZQG1_9GAMM|nr:MULTISPECIES: hypothetical protein [Pantoea]PWV69338.1 hypothetical protein C7425_101251 [Pantoea ananatis]QGF26390.1 hypothetical protein EE896_05835 [Pantoea eucalypti]TPV45213.1 hypothetical protein FJW02_00450 [Pantoea eucalypti]
MKLKIEIVDSWPIEAIEKGGFNHINYLNDLFTPEMKRLFVIEGDMVTEHTIMAPILSDVPEDSLLRIKVFDPNNFLIEIVDKWPNNVSPKQGFIPKEKFNKLGFGYLAMIDKISVLPSHIEFKALLPYYKNHLAKNGSWPLIIITKV